MPLQCMMDRLSLTQCNGIQSADVLCPSVALTWPRVGDGGCRHGDGNANTAAAAVLPAAAASAAATGGATGRGEDVTSQQPAQTGLHKRLPLCFLSSLVLRQPVK